MIPAASPATNPLAVFLENARPHDKVPVPLQSTAFDILIESGLAIVTTTRLFRNVETSTIEATLTFPVPVHAVLFSLDIRIGERRLQATAKAREAARSTYEEGLEEGKTAILHEELLRGIHMLSVGNIPPGQEIEVKTVWTMPLTMAGGEGHLRIPTTVGQIYGQSPLADGDDFTWGSDVPLAEVTVRSNGAPVTIGGRAAGADPVKVRMNQPIVLTIGGWQTIRLTSRTASGEAIELELSPATVSSSTLSLAILVDHSGSMEDVVDNGEAGKKTVHDLVVSALKALSTQLANEDLIDLWEFSHEARRIGESTGNKPPFSRLIRELSPPDGGTEINGALLAVLGATKANSILLITDGRSHALDVQALAGRGKRISVLLVGEDSLEAQVGHLAALTGGDIFVAPRNAVDTILAAALNSLRSPSRTVAKAGSAAEMPEEFSLSGMTIRLRRKGKADAGPRSILEHGVAALVASLQLPRLSEGDAAGLAASEGLVTHLTSLVLVDEAASVQESISLRRRIPLAPAQTTFAYAPNRQMIASMSSLDNTSHSSGRLHRMASSITPPPNRGNTRQSILSRALGRLLNPVGSLAAKETPEDSFHASLDSLAPLVEWDEFAHELSLGWVDPLDEAVAEEIRRLARSPAVIILAREHSLDALRIIIFLLAKRASAQNNRSATRVMYGLRKDLSPGTINAILLLDGGAS
jgi:hypothetical protein